MTREIILSGGWVTIVDESDFNMASAYNWYASFNPHTNSYYAKTRIPKPCGIGFTSMFLSRFLMHAEPASVVDHINHNTLDNRRCNLRIVTSRQNSQNRTQRYKERTSKYIGVSYDKINKKYRADITINGKRINLGRYINEEEAASAYITSIKGVGL